MPARHSRLWACLVAGAALLACLLSTPACAMVLGRPLSKRSFFDIQCKGVYDKSIFARLDRICEDCYNLFREPSLHSLCRKGCFTTDFFKGCLDALLLHDELQDIQTWIKQLHGAEPRDDCYSTVYFNACVEALTLKDDLPTYQTLAESLG